MPLIPDTHLKGAEAHFLAAEAQLEKIRELSDEINRSDQQINDIIRREFNIEQRRLQVFKDLRNNARTYYKDVRKLNNDIKRLAAEVKKFGLNLKGMAASTKIPQARSFASDLTADYSHITTSFAETEAEIVRLTNEITTIEADENQYPILDADQRRLIVAAFQEIRASLDKGKAIRSELSSVHGRMNTVFGHCKAAASIT